jgi:hypothetical protein
MKRGPPLPDRTGDAETTAGWPQACEDAAAVILTQVEGHAPCFPQPGAPTMTPLSERERIGRLAAGQAVLVSVRRCHRKEREPMTRGDITTVAANGTSLLRYEAACRALATAKSVDEVQNICSTSEAMRAYARQAKNKQMEVDAAEIRIRAEQRLGEMMREQKETVGLNIGGRPQKTTSESDVVSGIPSLASIGIDVHLADRARKTAAVPRGSRCGHRGHRTRPINGAQAATSVSPTG